jgi:membrane-associated phospholipid phosphatase
MADAAPSLAQAVVAEWRTKLWLFPALAIFYGGGYLLIQRHLCRMPISFTPLAIDRWVPFSLAWLDIYQSIYLMVPVALLARTRDQLRAFAIGLLGFALVSFAIFILLPVRGPRLADCPTTGMYGMLIQIDLPLNTFPSLHMAAAAYFSCVAIRLTGGRLRQICTVVIPIWVIIIAYSTLATKQHYAVDVPSGVAIGLAAYWVAWRKVRRNPPDPTSVLAR